VRGIWVQQHARGEVTLVMVRRPERPSDWDLPGGTPAAGETLAEAVVRAVEAETGESVLCGPFAGWFEVLDDGPHRVTMVFELVAAAPEEQAPSGGVEVRQVPEWEVSELPVAAGVTEFLADQGLIELVI
jgi:ADP-ribose pyrophosphatase YjhB (NUDIX family)